MKKYEKSLYVVLFVLLIGILVSLSIYLITNDKKNNENTNNNSNMNNNGNIENNENFNNVELSSIYKKYAVVLNGKERNVEIRFDYYYDDNYQAHAISGYFNDLRVFDDMRMASEYEIEEFFNLNYIKKYFNENNFKVIRGEDGKDYIAIVAYFSGDGLLYIFNDEFNLLTNDITYEYQVDYEKIYVDGFTIKDLYYQITSIEGNSAVGYEDKFNMGTNNDSPIYVKIENNKIFYLARILNRDNNDKNILEERVYTINANKLKYEVINNFKIIEISNQI